MNKFKIFETLYNRLEEYGAIKWHKSLNKSYYIKFKDVRLGSIRIADHKGRNKYNYTYEIYQNDKDIECKIEKIVNQIMDKSKRIYNFNPKKFIVFYINNYIEVENLREYKEVIFKKKIN